MTPGQILDTVKFLAFAVAVAAVVWFWQHYKGLVEDKQQLTAAVAAHTAAIQSLTARARATDTALKALDADARSVRRQTTNALSALDKARLHDPQTQSFDRPWPAAVRFRVFDNPDPAAGSADCARVADTGECRVDLPVAR